MKSSTQFAGPKSNEICDVVVGFDFGTSCCKVVIRTPYHNASRAFAVPFDVAGHSTCRYLLPSVLWVTRDGRVSLQRVKKSVLLRDIKLHLMRGDSVPAIDGGKKGKCNAKIAAVAFVASALRMARKWFLREHRSVYGGYKLRWTFNVGLPSEDYSNEALCSAYRDIADAAWYLSIFEADARLTDVEKVLHFGNGADAIAERDSAEINLVPEVAAEVAGYARSHMRDEGLHILIDIGATTLDVCSFILHEREGDDCYELLTADVKPLGASILYQQRVSAVRKAVDTHVGALWNLYDPVSAMPDGVEAYSPCPDALAKSIERHDQEYAKQCLQRIWKTVIDLKTKRDPRSPRWHSHMPMFVSGGGSAMAFYQSQVSDLSEQLGNFYTSCHGLRTLSLTKPDNFEADVDGGTYHRLAVAWGLSYPETDIGEVCRPGDIEDIEPPPVHDWRRGFVSKDMV